jgi:drug/metabolite transporter (DMT)-like permease
MTKLLLILVVGLFFEAVGVIYLNRGLKQVGDIRTVSIPEITRVAKRGLTNHNVLLGVLFEAIFFGCLLVLMSRADVSFIWPLTALGYLLTTLAARFILREQVSPLRWSGVMLIMMGAALVTWSEKEKSKPPDQPVTSTTPAGPSPSR